MKYETILDFWFKKIDSSQWFRQDEEFDQLIVKRFQKVHDMANHCELFHWRETAEGRLAEIIVLDQFSRNIYRNTAKAFASDPLALCLAQEAIANKCHLELDNTKKAFLYMPYMHSESKQIHEIAIKLYSEKGLESNYDYELRHKEIIDRFGRYPHRNKILSRESTDKELVFLTEPGSSF